MTLPDKDDNWEWVVKPEEVTTAYSGNDLSREISVGNRIAELRAKAGLSAQEIEDYAGVSKANLLAIEAGLLKLDTATAGQLAMVLGVSVAVLNA